MSEQPSEKKSQKSRGQDILGVSLLMLGGFAAASIVLFLRGQRSESWLARPVDGLVGLMGPWAGLLLAMGVAGLGVYLFLAPKDVRIGRHLLGSVGVGLALSLVVGALSVEAGGAIGSALPDALPAALGRIGGAAIGVIALLATVSVVWMGASAGLRKKPEGAASLFAPSHADDAEGVSAAEAQALQPIHRSAVLASTAPAGSPPKPVHRPTTPQEDIRLHGGVPEGARPLGARDEARPKPNPTRVRKAEPDVELAPAAPATPDQPSDPDLVEEPERSDVVADLDRPGLRAESGASASGALGSLEASPIETPELPTPSWEAALEEPFEDELGPAVPLEVAEEPTPELAEASDGAESEQDLSPAAEVPPEILEGVEEVVEPGPTPEELSEGRGRSGR